MKLRSLSFIVTDDCNFNCSYCRQKKEKKYMTLSTAAKAVDFFYPFLDPGTYIIFYGGEPLLAFDTIKQTVALFLEKDREGGKDLKFSVTTNGSLLSDEILDFLHLHHFKVLLSFDGSIQESCRKPGSLVPTRELTRRLAAGAYPDIQFSTNSVFTPATVRYLSASLKEIIDTGVTELQYSLARTQPWDDAALLTLEKELERFGEFLVAYYRKKGRIPLTNFRRGKPDPGKKGLFACQGGQDRMAVTPGEQVWGCFFFHEYLKDSEGSDDFNTYSFGKLDDFIKNHHTTYPGIMVNYGALRQDCFFSGDRHCFLCREVNSCSTCPVSAAYATSFIGKVPLWICNLGKTMRKGKEKFSKEIEKIDAG